MNEQHSERTTGTNSVAGTGEILDCERQRIEAILGCDYTKLRDILADDLIHVHSSGRAETVQCYIEGLSDLAFISIIRGPLTMRRHGNAIFTTGTLSQVYRNKNAGEEQSSELLVTQGWVQVADTWKLASFHACRASK